MLARFFLILLDQRKRVRFVLLGLLLIALAWLGRAQQVDGWVRLAAAPILLLLLAALEPMLIVLVAGEAGVYLGETGWRGYATGLLVATAAVGVALARWRRRSPALPAAAGSLVLIAAATLDPLLLVNAAVALVLAPLGTQVLLPRRRGGAPTLLSLAGGCYIFAYGLVLQLFMLWVQLGLLRRPIEAVRRTGQRGMRGIFRTFFYGRRDLEDLDRLDLSRPAVVVSNHQSSVDIVLVLGIPGDVRLTTSPRVWDEPWLGFSARRLGHLRVDENLLASSRAVVEEGASVHFYPEGTRSFDGYPARFRRGAFELAVQLGLDIQPLVFCDTRITVPRDAYWVDRFHLAVRALPRVPPGDDSRALQKRVQAQVRAAFVEEMERINTIGYLRSKVRRLYRYQGWRVLRSVRAQLARAQLPARPTEEPAVIDPCGYGVSALLLAECHAGVRIRARERDEKMLAVARHAAANHPRIKFERRD